MLAAAMLHFHCGLVSIRILANPHKLEAMHRGAHIKVYRGGYWHHGIAMGDGTVIHLAGDSIWKSEASVRRADLEDFAKGGEIKVVDWQKLSVALSVPVRVPEFIAAEAESHLDRCGYNLIFNNCEQFSIYCVTGDVLADVGQVQDAFRDILDTDVPVLGQVPVLGNGINVLAGCAKVVGKKAWALAAYRALVVLEAKVADMATDSVEEQTAAKSEVDIAQSEVMVSPLAAKATG